MAEPSCQIISYIQISTFTTVATHSNRASAAAVDELDDGVRVVGVVDGERFVGECVAVVVEEMAEVGRNLLRIRVAHARLVTTVVSCCDI